MKLNNFNTDYLSRGEVAELKCIGSESTLDRLVKQGLLKKYKFGVRTFFKRTEVEDLISKRLMEN